MSLAPQLTNPYLDALVIGIVYGLGVCTASCLPYVASYVAGVGAGFRQGTRISLIFNGGRILAYALIGLLVGLIGGLVTTLAPNALSPFQIYSSLVFGAITAAIGASILLRTRKKHECSDQETAIKATQRMGRYGIDFGAFSLGISRGLIICPPLVLLLTYALPFSTPLGSMTIAVIFGVGTTISPLLVLGGVTGWLLNKAPLFRKWVSLAGGGILIALGVFSILNSIIQWQ